MSASVNRSALVAFLYLRIFKRSLSVSCAVVFGPFVTGADVEVVTFWWISRQKPGIYRHDCERGDGLDRTAESTVDMIVEMLFRFVSA